MRREIQAATPRIAGAPAPPLRVGSWPGPSYTHNSFIPILCDAQVRAGASILDIADETAFLAQEIDVLLIHWPEQLLWRGGGKLKVFLRIAKALIDLARLRFRGVKLIWMVHNLKPHDASRLRLRIWQFLVFSLKRLIDGYVSLSAATRAPIVERLGLRTDTPFATLRHPLYPDGPAQGPARARIGLDERARVFVFFGTIRPYKGVEHLIEVFHAIEDPAARLILAGAPSGAAMRERLLAAAARDARIVLRLGYLEEAELCDLVAAADRVVLPFVETLHSGSLVRALSQHRPAITPRTDFSQSLQDEIGVEWLHLYDGPLRADHLAPSPPPTRAPTLALYRPEVVGRELVDFYRQVIEGAR